MIRPAALVLYFASFMLLVGTVSAAPSVTVSSVTAGGVNHLVVYPLNDNSKAVRVESALPTIISNYEITTWLAKNHGVKNTIGGR